MVSSQSSCSCALLLLVLLPGCDREEAVSAKSQGFFRGGHSESDADTHRHRRGRGHEEHGNGHGWGHHRGDKGKGDDDDCDCVCEPPAQECSWSLFGTGLGSGNVQEVSFDPRDPSIVVAGEANRIHRSQDGGLTWEEVAELQGSVSRISFASDGSQWLAGTTGGIYSSSNSGDDWEQVSLGGLNVEDVAISPTLPQRVYASVGGAGMLLSHDGGRSFSPINQGILGIHPEVVSVSPSDASKVVVGSIAFNQENGFSSLGGTLLTVNGGGSWTTTHEARRVDSLSRCPSNEDVLVATQATSGLLASRDGGVSWQSIAATGLWRAVAVGGVDCELLYGMARERGFFRSRDFGETWEGPLNSGLMTKTFRARDLELSSDGSTLLVGTTSGAFRSSDDGESWTELSGLGIPAGLALQDGGQVPRVSWMGSWGAGLWRLVGLRWTRNAAYPSDFARFVEVSPHDPSFLVSGDFWSDDLGLTWLPTGEVQGVTDALFHPHDESFVLLTSQVAGIHLSVDGGLSFAASNAGLESFDTSEGHFIDVRRAVKIGERIFIATFGRGVYFSDDWGASWAPFGTHLSQAAVSELASNGDALAAVVPGEGVFFSESGSDWVQRAAGLESLEVNDVQWVEGVDTWYASTPEGVYSLGESFRWNKLPEACGGVGSLALHEASGASQLIGATQDGVRIIGTYD